MFLANEFIVTTKEVFGQQENTIGKADRIYQIKAPTVDEENMKYIFGQIILVENDIYTYRIAVKFEDENYSITTAAELNSFRKATEREVFLYHIYGPHVLKINLKKGGAKI